MVTVIALPFKGEFIRMIHLSRKNSVQATSLIVDIQFQTTIYFRVMNIVNESI